MTNSDELPQELELTNFDLARLEDMSEGDTIDGECGLWRVIRYSNSYSLILDYSSIMTSQTEFTSIDKLKHWFNNFAKRG
ncbi:MAG: hypothetical protein AABY22_32630 [Nanoarchaeota archaeon]